MNGKAQGSLLLLGTIILSSGITYILTKAKYTKQSHGKTGNKPLVHAKKNEEIALKVSKEKDDISKYIEKYSAKSVSPVYSHEDEHPAYEIIDEDIFDTNPDYETITFTLYRDGILADENNHIVTDPENNVGIETVEDFDALENDGAVYVRNHKIKTDFEILRDLRLYSEVIGGDAYDERS